MDLDPFTGSHSLKGFYPVFFVEYISINSCLSSEILWTIFYSKSSSSLITVSRMFHIIVLFMKLGNDVPVNTHCPHCDITMGMWLPWIPHNHMTNCLGLSCKIQENVIWDRGKHVVGKWGITSKSESSYTTHNYTADPWGLLWTFT